jgi:hypothetical protein
VSHRVGDEGESLSLEGMEKGFFVRGEKKGGLQWIYWRRFHPLYDYFLVLGDREAGEVAHPLQIWERRREWEVRGRREEEPLLEFNCRSVPWSLEGAVLLMLLTCTLATTDHRYSHGVGNNPLEWNLAPMLDAWTDFGC